MKFINMYLLSMWPDYVIISMDDRLLIMYLKCMFIVNDSHEQHWLIKYLEYIVMYAF